MNILIDALKEYRIHMLLSLLFVVVGVFAQLLQPRLLQDIISGILNNDLDNLWEVGVWIVIIAAFGLIAGIANAFLAAKVSNGVGADLREKLFRKIQSLSASNIEKFTTSSLIVRQTNDIQTVQMLTMSLMQSIFNVPLLFIGALLFAIITLPQLWWIVLFMVVGIMGISISIMGSLTKRFERIQLLVDKINTLTKDNLVGIKIVKSFVQEKNQVDQFANQSTRLMKENITVSRMIGVMAPSFLFIANIAMILALFMVSRLITVNPSTLAAFVPFLNYLTIIMMVIVTTGVIMANATSGMVSIGRIREVLETTPDINYEDDSTLEKVNGEIEFNNVSFAYPEDKEHSLSNVSFKIHAGETIGIVGATGSGKSTVAQLMTRLYDPQEGEIRVDGRCIKTIGKQTLRDSISIVLQKAVIFSGSIAYNLKHGYDLATPKTMFKACNIAQASSFVNRLDHKLETTVEERGSNFSGGQRQRLSIARGIIGKPSILILDDSTSALDARSEKLVSEGLQTELKDTTKIIIAQKLSSVITADKILVLDAGYVVGFANHQTLLKTCSVYQEIYQTQKGQAAA